MCTTKDAAILLKLPKILIECESLTLLTNIVQNEYLLLLVYAKLAHPAQSDTPSYILNNAMGNVFSYTRRNQ
jgi:hypothetical protein